MFPTELKTQVVLVPDPDRGVKEEASKAFNLSLLLPDEAQRNIDSATLFPFAYKASDARSDNPFKSRFSIFPIVIGVPIAVLIVLAAIYHLNISWVLDQIQAMVNY